VNEEQFSDWLERAKKAETPEQMGELVKEWSCWWWMWWLYHHTHQNPQPVPAQCNIHFAR